MELIKYEANSKLDFELMSLSRKADFASYSEKESPKGLEVMIETMHNEFSDRMIPYGLLDYYFERFSNLNS